MANLPRASDAGVSEAGDPHPAGAASEEREYECCVIGAGPAGLGAVTELTKHGVTDILIVDRNSVVGGLARTEDFGDARFDVGPHRFFSKNEEINTLWHETLGPDFRSVSRLTRIFYKGKLFLYPVKAGDVFSKLGLVESAHVGYSYAVAQVSRGGQAQTFEEWVTKKFGRKLYETFFKTYTEKVWGIPCDQIGAEWAAQRIKGLDLAQVVKNALPWGRAKGIKTLVDEFDYPVRGAGQMYEVMAQNAQSLGVELSLETDVVSFDREGANLRSVVVRGSDGELRRIRARHFFNSAPLTRFCQLLTPSPPEPVARAAEALYYREHVTVNLLLDGEDLFPDQWIYVHSPDVKMARLANYNNFSDSMVKAKNKTAVSVEYFTFKHEELWRLPDEDLMDLAVAELDRMGLAGRGRVEGRWVVRETESYPTYYLGFEEPYSVLKAHLGGFANLSPIGRGGMYKYNNQDHSTMSGILAARNYLKLEGSPYDVWSLNIDADYQESAARPS